MIERLLPPMVRSAAMLGDAVDLDVHPAEIEQLGAVAECRRDDFGRGRTCARGALAQMGVTGAPVLLDDRRAPVWPVGVVGSITHCRGFAAAAVARQDEVAAVGIDAEVHGPLSVGTAGKVCTPAELAWATEAPGAGLVSWPTVLFSARESVYKAWHPITGAWLGFLDVDITVDVEGGAFTARLREWVQAPPGSGAPRTFTGRFLVTNDHVLTTVVVALGGDPP